MRAQVLFELLVDFGIAMAFISVLMAGFYGLSHPVGSASANTLAEAKYAYNVTASLGEDSRVQIVGG